MPVSADASAHFTQYDIIVTLGDKRYTLPGEPASTWLAILTPEQIDGSQILPGMLSLDEQEQVEDLLLSGELAIVDLTQAIRDVITEASGHPWWWTLGILSTLRGEHGTQILGEMAQHNPDLMPFGAWLNALYARLVKYMKEQDKAQFDAQLDSPPADVEIKAEELIDEAAATATFMSMMGQRNG